jgi:hypothetical protein
MPQVADLARQISGSRSPILTIWRRLCRHGAAAFASTIGSGNDLGGIVLKVAND